MQPRVRDSDRSSATENFPAPSSRCPRHVLTSRKQVAAAQSHPVPARKENDLRCRHPRAPQSTQCHAGSRSEEHTSELQSQSNLVCRLLLEKKKKATNK